MEDANDGADHVTPDQKAKQKHSGWTYKPETYHVILTWLAETKIKYKADAKRPGTKSYERYSTYSQANTVGEALAAGSKNVDFCHDYQSGFIAEVGGSKRSRPLDMDMWSDLVASSQLTDWDKAVRSFIGKASPIIDTPENIPNQADTGEKAPKRAKTSKPLQTLADSDVQIPKSPCNGKRSGANPDSQSQASASSNSKRSPADPKSHTPTSPIVGKQPVPDSSLCTTPPAGKQRQDDISQQSQEKNASSKAIACLQDAARADKLRSLIAMATELGYPTAEYESHLAELEAKESRMKAEKDAKLQAEEDATSTKSQGKEQAPQTNFLAALAARQPKACKKDVCAEKAARITKEAEEEIERVAAGDDAETDENSPEELHAEAWDVGQRRELANNLWTETSLAEQPKQQERTTFGQVLDAYQDLGNPVGVVANLLRPLFTRPDAVDEITGLVDLLLASHGQMTSAHIGECVSRAFALNSAEVRAKPSKILETAMKARRQQRKIFQGRGVMAADIGKAIAAYRDGEGAKYSPWNAIPDCLLEQLSKVIGLTKSEQETGALVRIFQGQCRFSLHTVLRGLSHASVVACSSQNRCPSQFVDSILLMEDAVLRSFAQTDGRIKSIVAGLCRGASARELVEASSPTSGVRVLSMRAESPTSMANSLERLEEGPLVAEWLYHGGERIQVHVTKGGDEFEIFGKRLIWGKASPSQKAAAEEVSSIMSNCLNIGSDCILEAILLKSRRPADAAQMLSEITGETAQADPGRVMVVLDVLSLDGKSFCQTSLLERRAHLRKIIMPSNRVRLAHSVELASPTAADIVPMLQESLGASDQYRNSSDATERLVDALGFTRTRGLILKRLDSHFVGGRRHAAWQEVERQAATGADGDKALFDQLSEEAKKCLPSKDEFLFCVISGRRTGTREGIRDIMKIQNLYANAGVSPRWYVDVESLESYRKLGLDAYPGGKLIPSRNMALEDAFKDGKVCVQTSDDIQKWQFLVSEGEKCTMSDCNAAARAAVARLDILPSPVGAAQFLLAEMRSRSDCKLGGVYCLSNAGRALCQDRFGDHQFIMGDFFVAEPSDIRFDTRLDLKEDYDYTAAHLEKFGSVLRCNHMMIYAKHLTNAGGACSYRNGEREQRNIKILREKWGNAIRDNPHRANEIVLYWGRR